MRFYPFGSGSQLYTPASASKAAYSFDALTVVNVISSSYAIQGPSGSIGASGQCIQQSGSTGDIGNAGLPGAVGIIGIPGEDGGE